MKKIIFFLLISLCLFIPLSGISQAQNTKSCGTVSPGDDWEQWFQTKIAEHKINLSTNRIAQINYTIPVIVHVVYWDASQNISQAQVNSQFDILNADYSAVGLNVGNVPSSLASLVTNTNISFCPAKKKIDGSSLAQPGIDRINAQSLGLSDPSTTHWDISYINNNIKINTIWDPTKYMNIWVVPCIYDNRTGSCSILGFATYPAGSDLSGIPSTSIGTNTNDGVVISYKAFGNVGTAQSPYNLGRTATHEIGHWLGLRHLWGDENCGTDYCNDTPTQADANYGCPTFPHKTCGNSANGDLFMNFMDYTDDACMYMFTPDQNCRIQTAMINGTFRNTLSNSTACVANLPDLTIIAQNANPTNVNAGGNITLSFAEDNSGGASSAPNVVSFHISQNNILTPGANGDQYIGEYYVNQTLVPNSQTISLNKSVTIPSTLASGTYYIFFSADGAESVNESNEFNNFATKIINVTNTGGSTCSPTVPTNRTQTPYQTYAQLNWNTVSGVANYIVRYRTVGFTNWQYEYPSSNSLQISGLYCNTSYEWQVSSKCADGNTSAYSSSNTFSTSLCGTTQNNDNCSNAITLVSSTNCNPVSGTVANASTSGYYIPTCGVYQASATALDVWYKFVAQATSETITVDPEGNTNSNEYMDVVIGLYSQCTENNLLECYDKPSTGIGGGVTTTYTFNGLTVGNTYYVRVYDWGSIPPIYSGFTICVTHQTSSSNNNHDFYIQDLNVNSSSFSPGDPLIINASQYTTNPLATSANVNMDYTIRTNSGNLIQRVGTDNSTVGNGTAYNAENISTTFPNGYYGSSCLICAEANYDLAISESNTNNNRSCVSVAIGNSNNHDFTIQNPNINATVFNPGDYMFFNCRQYTNNPYGVSVNVNLEFTLRNSSGSIIQELGTSTSSLGGGSESQFAYIGMDFPLTVPAGNYQVCVEANYDRLVSESNANNNLFCYNIVANGCPSCSYALNSNNMSFQSGGGTGNINITTNRCCSWSAVSNTNWITVTNGDFLGNGTVFYTVEPCNSGTTRTGSITVAGQTFTITQNCSQACNLSQSFEWGTQAGSSTLSDAASDLAIDASGNLFMTGDIQGAANFGNGIVLTTPSTAPDIFVSKHNSSGQIQWAVRYGNTTQEEGQGIVTDNNGNIYVSGYFSNSITFGSTTLIGNASNNYTAFLIKLNSSGVLQWARKVNPTNTIYNAKLAIDRNNNIYVAGFHTDNSIYIAKYNSSGTQNWIQTYLNTPSSKYLRDVTCDNNGNVIIAGNFSGSITLAGNTINTSSTLLFDRDGYVAKFDNNGNPLWIKQVASPHFDDQDEIAGVTTDNSNNIYVTGHVDTTATMGNVIIPMLGTRDYKAIIFKLDPNGNAIWGKGSNNGFQIPKSIVAGNDKDIYIAGYFADTFSLDNKYIISNGSSDGFVTRIDSNGIVKWMKTIGGTLADEAFGVAVNNTNDVYVAGGFSGTVSYGSTTLTSNGSTDIFLTKFKQCDLPIANITYTGSPTICNGQSKLLSTPYCATNAYQWYLNGNLIVNANNATYNATQAGTYTVKVSAFAGCESTSNSVVISVSNNPNPVIAGNNYLCSNSSTQLDAGSGYTSYLWSNSATTRQINISNPGTYTVTVKNASNCSATAYKTIIPLATPTANITHTNLGNNYSFFSNALGDSIQYNWYFGDGSSSIQANPTHNYSTNGSYTVTLIVSNACGSNNYQTNINLATGIKNNSIASNINIYPNPNNGQFIIELNSKQSGTASINIINTLGQVIQSSNVNIKTNENKIPINLSGIANGTYHIHLIIDNEKYTDKIIKIE